MELLCTVGAMMAAATTAAGGGPPPPAVPALQFSTGFTNDTILQRGDVGVAVFGFTTTDEAVTVSACALLCAVVARLVGDKSMWW